MRRKYLRRSAVLDSHVEVLNSKTFPAFDSRRMLNSADSKWPLDEFKSMRQRFLSARYYLSAILGFKSFVIYSFSTLSFLPRSKSNPMSWTIKSATSVKVFLARWLMPCLHISLAYSSRLHSPFTHFRVSLSSSGARCGGKFAPFFCANVTCLQYYCEHCWATIHSRPGREFHKPLVKEGADRPRIRSFHKPHDNYVSKYF